MILLAVDPGIRGSGAALFSAGVLVRAGYVVSRCTKGCGASEAAAMADAIIEFVQPWMPTEIAVEWPRVYATSIRMGKSKGDPNDLLALAGVDAAVAVLLMAKASSYAPSDWKGQLTKEACHARIRGRLDTDELGVMSAASERAKSKAHNMIDAVGIGLYHLGRFKRERVIP